jgi:neutral/alkaline ceramidase-like enzyme
MRIGLGKVDITPRVGVELCGYGPFLCRKSQSVRDRLYARAVAVEDSDGGRIVLVSCDLVGVDADVTTQARQIVCAQTRLNADRIMVHCIHTHSGPATAPYNGWGERDLPYMTLLPQRVAQACLDAVASLAPAELGHAAVPCEGIGLNRELDRFSAPLEEILDEAWRPAMPEVTDTTCHVLTIRSNGRLRGFISYFGCHPVVCGSDTHAIHGDYAGVATNLLERELPGAVGLFLQGAQGDVNACIVASDEPQGLRALDVVASRYARSVRRGIQEAKPLVVDGISSVRHQVHFTRKPWTEHDVEAQLREAQEVLTAPAASDDDHEFRMAVVCSLGLRKMLASLKEGREPSRLVELQGFRIGPVSLLASPFEVHQAIKRDVLAAAKAPIPLVMGLTNDTLGYAPDRESASRGGYAGDVVPLICGELPFARVHDELVEALLGLDAELAGGRLPDCPA